MAPGYTAIDNDTVLDRLPEIDGTALKVFLALVRRADQAGRCWPSIDTIARDTGLHRRAAQLALGRLRGLALVNVESRSGKATIYHLTRAPSCAPCNSRSAQECAPGAHDDAHGCAPSCAGGAHGDAPKQETRTRTKNKADSALAKRFVPPTLEDIQVYCRERQNSVDAEHFLDYHEARGWKLKGGQAVKDWRACVRTWEHNGFQNGTTTTPNTNEPPRRVFQ